MVETTWDSIDYFLPQHCSQLVYQDLFTKNNYASYVFTYIELPWKPCFISLELLVGHGFHCNGI